MNTISHFSTSLSFLSCGRAGFLWLFVSFFLAAANLAKAENAPGTDSVTVYVFLSEECIISQYFTPQLNELSREFSDEETTFVGLFPNPSSTPGKMAAFGQKYGIDFPLKLDVLQRKMDEFSVKVTPEVVVFNHDKKKILYQGRIDNTFFRVGKRRTVTTTSDLRDALLSLRENREKGTTKTETVGCFITALNADLKNAPMCAPER